MKSGDDWEPSEALRDLLLEVLERRLSLDSPSVREAMQGEPRFAAFVHSAIDVAKALDDWHATERRAVTAASDPLEAVAVVAARSQHRQPSSASPARWPWVAFALAAGLSLVALLWECFGPAPADPKAPIHLSGRPPVQWMFEDGSLRLAPAPEPGQYYRIELRLGDEVLEPLILRRSDRLPAAELRQFGDDVRVRASLMQGDEELLTSGFLALKTITSR